MMTTTFRFVLPCVVLLAFVCAAMPNQSPAPATTPAPTPPRDHEWLKQLVGEWDVQFKMSMQPDQPPAESVGTDSVRTLGDHWIIAETKTTMMGAPYHGMLTLGYSPLKEHFIGTWIDSFGGCLWVYKGTLNDAGDTLTLETEGPSLLHGPDKTARYMEVIRITGQDSRTFTSSIENDDGSWMKILTIEYRRKAAAPVTSVKSQAESTRLGANQLPENTPNVHYLEIVTPSVDKTCDLLAKANGVTFSEPVAELGNARTAKLKDGGRIGVRAPMRADEESVVRPYILVDDIEAAVEAAKAAGGEFAILPTEIPGQGKFAIYFLDGIQYGLWQR